MKRIIAAVSCALVAASASAAYPDRPVKLIVPWAAGGDTDNIFRPFAPLLQKHLAQTVVIANVGGASGTVGEREAKNAPADGYTVFAPHDFVHSAYYTGVTDVRYTDFDPICMISSTPSVITASPKTPWKAWAQLQADAKARPGQITVGASLGSTSQFSMALVEKAAGIKFKYIPYDGLAPRMNAILGGHIDLTDSNLTQKSKVQAGLLKFIAIMSEKRNPEIPDVPTMKELGFNVVYAVSRGLMVPKGTPEAVQATLATACVAAAKEPAFANSMTLQGTEVRFLDRKGYAQFLKDNDALYKEISDELGLTKKR
ncbi:MAG: tripartite tricarboxylate transporter substrate binding protein [Proteobacteria bacterium]|nr:tripartite tricarboxylate transporter substrate binding protein [Pseudomonadota bacterium]